MKRKYSKLFEDENLIIVDKPGGMLTLPDRFRPELMTLVGLLKNKYSDVFPVHRLDKFTSGVVCFAKTAEAHRLLSMDFEARKVVKKYRAIVHGYPFVEAGEINEPIMLLDGQNKSRIHPKGKPSLTKFKLIEKFQDFALLELTIMTGRRHQIRVHLAHMSLPIVADGEYGKSSEWFLSTLKRKYNTKKWENERPLIKRHLLHADYLQFTHPITKEIVEAKAELPKDFRAMLSQLKKLNKIISN